MSGKVVQRHQLMEHEALSIETDFTHLKDNDFKSYLATGESLSSLKTALTRGEKLLLVDKPYAGMFIMGFDDVEQSEDDRLKVLIHGLKRMQVRRVNPAVNNDYPKDVIKAVDNRLGTASGGLNIGGMMYDNPSKDTLHPPAEMPKRVPEKPIHEPLAEPPKSNISPTFGMAPNRLVFKLVYDDKEQTKAANVPYTVIMEDGKNTQITGTLDKSGKAEVQPDTNHAAYILFGDEALAAEAQGQLDQAYSKLDNAITNSAKQSAQHAFDTLNKQQKVPVTQAFSEAVNNKLSEMNNQTQAFNNQSFLNQSWDMMKAAQSGSASGVNEYLPDLGDFGQLLDAADINITMLIEAIVTGDVDALEDKFQAWKERGKQGMWEATETMEMLILLLSDSQGRELIASLPARMLAALPPDKVVEMSAYHATQLGMDIAVVSGGTALGTLAGGVGGPIACASLLLAANSRKAGKVLEETVEVLGEMKDALKVVRNKHDKPQLYKKDHSIPNDQQDLNTRTFVTPLKEKATVKDNKKVAAASLLRKDPKLEQHYKDLAAYEDAYQKKLKKAIENGDSKRRQGAFKAKITEAKGERAAAMYMEKHFATPPPPAQMELGFGPGPGVDQIWSKRDKDGKVLEYFVVEAKGPGAKLQDTKTKGMQMSDQWVKSNLTSMKKSKKYPEKNQLGKDLLNAKKSRIKVNKLVIEAVEDNGHLLGGKLQPSP